MKKNSLIISKFELCWVVLISKTCKTNAEICMFVSLHWFAKWIVLKSYCWNLFLVLFWPHINHKISWYILINILLQKVTLWCLQFGLYCFDKLFLAVYSRLEKSMMTIKEAFGLSTCLQKDWLIHFMLTIVVARLSTLIDLTKKKIQ